MGTHRVDLQKASQLIETIRQLKIEHKAVHILLERFSDSETYELVEYLLGGKIDKNVGEKIFKQTEGSSGTGFLSG